MRPLSPLLVTLCLLAAKPPILEEADRLYEKGQFAEAAGLLRQFIGGGQFTALAPEDRAAVQANLGTIHHEVGDYNQAETAYRAAARHCGPSPLGQLCSIAMSNNLATLFLEIGELSRAEAEVAKNARRNLDAFPPDAAEVLRWWGNRGSIEYAHNRPAQALEWYQRALDGWTRRGQARSLDGVIALSNVGLALLEERRYDEAIRRLEQALDFVEGVPSHLKVRLPVALMNLGMAKLLAGRTAEAGSLLRRSVDESLERLGDAHVVTGTTMLRHADYLAKWGNKAEGKRLRKRATAILQSFGRNHVIGRPVDVSALALR